jgi:subtilisin family serine protease
MAAGRGRRAGWRRAAVLARVVFALVVGVVGLLVRPAPAHADWVRNDQWQLSALNVRTAWRFSTGAGVTVAVLDSGVDATHPDLAGQVLPGADFIDRTSDGRRDLVGHGTTVAGLIAGRLDDTAGVVGVAPHAKILPVRVLDDQNKYDDASVVADGLRWAVDQGARVVNMSLGGAGRSEQLAQAIAYAIAHDVVVIACTGNLTTGTPNQVWYPAREPGVVAVAGLSAAVAAPGGASPTGAGAGSGGGGSGTAGRGGEALWSGSLTGPQTVLAAPAVNLLGARPGGYWRVQGTSFAAPLVTATATLIRSRWPDLSAANVINRLIKTARDLGSLGRDDRYGYGEVNPVAALTSEVAPVESNPLDPGEAGVGSAAELDTTEEPVSLPAAVWSMDGSDLSGRRLRRSLWAGATVFVMLLLLGWRVSRRVGRVLPEH